MSVPVRPGLTRLTGVGALTPGRGPLNLHRAAFSFLEYRNHVKYFFGGLVCSC